MLIHFTDQTGIEAINSGKPVVIDFWAEWCGPCIKLGSVIEELAEKYGDKVMIGKMNIEECEEVPAMFKIRNIPTVLFIKEGKMVEKSVGLVKLSDLESKIAAIL